MSALFSILTTILLFIAFLAHIFGFPANWFIVAGIGLYDLINPDVSISWFRYCVLIGIAIFGELVEFVLQTVSAQKFGASHSGNWGAFLGALLGAVLGFPFLFGLGALLGGIFGAYFGCFGVEVLKKRPWHEAQSAAWGAMLGKFTGMLIKMILGIALLFQAFGVIY